MTKQDCRISSSGLIFEDMLRGFTLRQIKSRFNEFPHRVKEHADKLVMCKSQCAIVSRCVFQHVVFTTEPNEGLITT